MPRLLRAGKLRPGCGSQSAEGLGSWCWSPRAVRREGWGRAGRVLCSAQYPCSLVGRGAGRSLLHSALLVPVGMVSWCQVLQLEGSWIRHRCVRVGYKGDTWTMVEEPLPCSVCAGSLAGAEDCELTCRQPRPSDATASQSLDAAGFRAGKAGKGGLSVATCQS